MSEDIKAPERLAKDSIDDSTVEGVRAIPTLSRSLRPRA